MVLNFVVLPLAIFAVITICGIGLGFKTKLALLIGFVLGGLYALSAVVVKIAPLL